MNLPVRWLAPVRDAFAELSPVEQESIDEKIQVLRRYPHIYQLWSKSQRFRRHRQFVVGNWRVFYRVTDNVIWIRGIWPARLPLKFAEKKTRASKP